MGLLKDLYLRGLVLTFVGGVVLAFMDALKDQANIYRHAIAFLPFGVCGIVLAIARIRALRPPTP